MTILWDMLVWAGIIIGTLLSIWVTLLLVGAIFALLIAGWVPILIGLLGYWFYRKYWAR